MSLLYLKRFGILAVWVIFCNVFSGNAYSCCCTRVERYRIRAIGSLEKTLYRLVRLVAWLFFDLWLVCCLSWFVCSTTWCHWQAMFCGCGSSSTSSTLFFIMTAEKKFMQSYDKITTNSSLWLNEFTHAAF